MIADLDTFKTFLGIPETDDSQNELLNIYLNAVDGLFNELCDREFDSTAYTHQEYSGTGGHILRLKNMPVTAITQISCARRAALKVKNTSTDCTTAKVDIDVSASTITLTVVGGSNAGIDTIDLTAASYDTLSELVTAINALSDGWAAEIYNTSLNSIASTQLLEAMGVYVGISRDGGTAVYREFDIPDTPIDDYRIISSNLGEIYSNAGFYSGFNNIIVSYTAGYSSTTMPHDLKMGCLAGAQALYQRGEENGFGANNFSEGTLRITYGQWLPDYTLQMIEKYRRRSL